MLDLIQSRSRDHSHVLIVTEMKGQFGQWSINTKMAEMEHANWNDFAGQI